MHADVKGISEHMRDFGLHLLGKSVVEAIFAEIMNPYSHAMSVARCAQATEIIVKARISEEHPLLIFERLPGPSGDPALLDLATLLRNGRTIAFNELPGVLWATTGYRIPKSDQFLEFGRIRNTIMHLGVPNTELSDETMKFTFQVVEPMIRDFWDADIMEFTSAYDPDCEEYVSEQLMRLEISHPLLNP